jgi:hypothetical protein
MTTPDDEWIPDTVAPATPGAIVATPMVEGSDTHGKRLLIGHPGWGWRGDLRGGPTVISEGVTKVAVLAEIDWYRSNEENVEVFARLFPISEVWLETPGSEPSASPSARDVVSRLVSLNGPPRRDPIPVRDAPLVTGRRLVHMDGAVAHRDLRAVTEPYQSDGGDICVRVSTELDWYRWIWKGHAPDTVALPIYQLWVE